MTPAAIFETPAGRARVAPMAELRDDPGWREAFQHLVKDARYYDIVGGTLDFSCHGLLLEDRDGRLRGAQPFFFVDQDLVATAPRWLRGPIGLVRKFFPRFLRLKMLMVGCAAGEGHLGGGSERWGLPLMREVMVKVARAHQAALVVWKDFLADYRAPLDPLHNSSEAAACYVRIPSMPATRLELDYTSWDDYMARKLSHSMRKNLRRKFRALQRTAPLEMTVVNDLGDAVEEAHALYLQTYARSPLQFEKLTREFLSRIGQEMPERARFFLWRQNGRLVAFSLCLVHDGALYDEYLGLDYAVALDLHLYFVTFRDILSWALAQGLRTYYSTPLNYDPKLHLGFALAPLDLYVAHRSPVANALLRHILPIIQPTRAEPALRHFENAHEMLPV
jgi:hypothetical protein